MALLKTEFSEGYCEIRISSLCCDVLHELFWCGDCAYSHISFIRECTDARDVSYVTGEGVELTVHNKSVVVEEIKKVDV